MRRRAAGSRRVVARPAGLQAAGWTQEQRVGESRVPDVLLQGEKPAWMNGGGWQRARRCSCIWLSTRPGACRIGSCAHSGSPCTVGKPQCNSGQCTRTPQCFAMLAGGVADHWQRRRRQPAVRCSSQAAGIAPSACSPAAQVGFSKMAGPFTARYEPALFRPHWHGMRCGGGARWALSTDKPTIRAHCCTLLCVRNPG